MKTLSGVFFNREKFLRSLRGGDPAACIAKIRPGIDLSTPDQAGYPPLILAAMNVREGFEDVALKLIACGADINGTNNWGQTALIKAAETGKAWLAEALLKAGMDINQKCHAGNTPLLCAASCGHEKLTRLLLASNADPHIKNRDGNTAYDYAKTVEIGNLLEDAMNPITRETAPVSKIRKNPFRQKSMQ